MSEHVDSDRLALIPFPSSAATATEPADPDIDSETSVDISVVLESLADDKCRAILTRLDDPKSANVLREECGFPRSTVYRKLDQLREAELVREYTDVRRDGPNATLYERDFREISIGITERSSVNSQTTSGEIDDTEAFTATITRSPTDTNAEDRMATFFSEMKPESGSQ